LTWTTGSLALASVTRPGSADTTIVDSGAPVVIARNVLPALLWP
jgi:hypothetical protein